MAPRKTRQTQRPAAKPTPVRRAKQTKKARKELKVRLPTLTKDTRVPAVEMEEYTQDLPDSATRVRSEAQLWKKKAKAIRSKLVHYLRCVPIFKCNETLEDLENSKPALDALQHICDTDLGPDQPAQVFSGQWHDANDHPIMFYFAQRWADAPTRTGPLPLSDQYIGRTQSDLDEGESMGRVQISDGLVPKQQRRALEAIQQLSSVLHPVCPEKDKRHNLEHDPNGDPRVMRYKFIGKNRRSEIKEERGGVHHLVSGWIQQAQANKGLFLSSDLSRTGSAIVTGVGYFVATQYIVKHLAILFETCLPDCYATYRSAFEAGQWIDEDPGPWLGRAIVYKLQVELHNDKHDGGPTVSFPLGNFTGGNLLIPQLGAKLAYSPGHVCLFYSSALYHAVTRWEPGVMKHGDLLTPGRVGNVFFGPGESHRQLEGKPAGWARRTGYGRNPSTSYSRPKV